MDVLRSGVAGPSAIVAIFLWSLASAAGPPDSMRAINPSDVGWRDFLSWYEEDTAFTALHGPWWYRGREPKGSGDLKEDDSDSGYRGVVSAYLPYPNAMNSLLISPALLTSSVYFAAFRDECMQVEYRFQNVSAGAWIRIETQLSSGIVTNYRQVTAAGEDSQQQQGVWRITEPITLPTESEWQIRLSASGYGYAEYQAPSLLQVGDIRFKRCSYITIGHDLLCSFTGGQTCGFSTTEWIHGSQVARSMADATWQRRTGDFFLPNPRIPFRKVFTSHSPIFAPTKNKCLQFFYKLRRRGSGTLRVSVVANGKVTQRWEEVATRLSSRSWHSVGLALPEGTNFQIRLESMMLSSYSRRMIGRIGIDDITIVPCHKEPEVAAFNVSAHSDGAYRSHALAPSSSTCHRVHLTAIFNGSRPPESAGASARVSIHTAPLFPDTKPWTSASPRLAVDMAAQQRGTTNVQRTRVLSAHPWSVFRYVVQLDNSSQLLALTVRVSTVNNCRQEVKGCSLISCDDGWSFGEGATMSSETDVSKTVAPCVWIPSDDFVLFRYYLPPRIEGKSFLWTMSFQNCYLDKADQDVEICTGTVAMFTSPMFLMPAAVATLENTMRGKAPLRFQCLSLQYYLECNVVSYVYYAYLLLTVDGSVKHTANLTRYKDLTFRDNNGWSTCIIPLYDIADSDNDRVFQLRFSAVGYRVAVGAVQFHEQDCEQTRGIPCNRRAAVSQQCQHLCTELYNGSRCACHEGYALTHDSVSCEPVCNPPCLTGMVCTSPDVCVCRDNSTCAARCLRAIGLRQNDRATSFRLPVLHSRTGEPCSTVVMAPTGRRVAMEIRFNTAYRAGVYSLADICTQMDHIVQLRLGKRDNSSLVSLCPSSLAQLEADPVRRVQSEDNTLQILHWLRDRHERQLLMFRAFSVDSACTNTCGSDQAWWQRCCFAYSVSVPGKIVPLPDATLHPRVTFLYNLPHVFGRSPRVHVIVNCTVNSATRHVDVLRHCSIPFKNVSSLAGPVGVFNATGSGDLRVGSYIAIVTMTSSGNTGHHSIRETLPFSMVRPPPALTTVTSFKPYLECMVDTSPCEEQTLDNALVSMRVTVPPCILAHRPFMINISLSTWWREPLAGDLTVRWNVTGFVSSDRVISYGQMQHHFDGTSSFVQISSDRVGLVVPSPEEFISRIAIQTVFTATWAHSGDLYTLNTIYAYSHEVYVLGGQMTPITNRYPALAEIVFGATLDGFRDCNDLLRYLRKTVQVVLRAEGGTDEASLAIDWALACASDDEFAADVLSRQPTCSAHEVKASIVVSPWLPAASSAAAEVRLILAVKLGDRVLREWTVPASTLAGSSGMFEALSPLKIYSNDSIVEVPFVSDTKPDNLLALVVHDDGWTSLLTSSSDQLTIVAGSRNHVWHARFTASCGMCPSATVVLSRARMSASDNAVLAARVSVRVRCCATPWNDSLFNLDNGTRDAQLVESSSGHRNAEWNLSATLHHEAVDLHVKVARVTEPLFRRMTNACPRRGVSERAPPPLSQSGSATIAEPRSLPGWRHTYRSGKGSCSTSVFLSKNVSASRRLEVRPQHPLADVRENSHPTSPPPAVAQTASALSFPIEVPHVVAGQSIAFVPCTADGFVCAKPLFRTWQSEMKDIAARCNAPNALFHSERGILLITIMNPDAQEVRIELTLNHTGVNVSEPEVVARRPASCSAAVDPERSHGALRPGQPAVAVRLAAHCSITLSAVVWFDANSSVVSQGKVEVYAQSREGGPALNMCSHRIQQRTQLDAPVHPLVTVVSLNAEVRASDDEAHYESNRQQYEYSGGEYDALFSSYVRARPTSSFSLSLHVCVRLLLGNLGMSGLRSVDVFVPLPSGYQYRGNHTLHRRILLDSCVTIEPIVQVSCVLQLQPTFILATENSTSVAHSVLWPPTDIGDCTLEPYQSADQGGSDASGAVDLSSGSGSSSGQASQLPYSG
eukprot:scpid7618/ scgid5726/ 